VRLSDAGLGCPDWPGCYGKLLGVPDTHHEVSKAEAAFPNAPVEAGKAWKEMIHRYLAGVLGLVIVALAALAVWPRRQTMIAPQVFLVGLVLVQAALGMLTVTWLLKPVIVTLHLLGGMLILTTLVAIHAYNVPPYINSVTPALQKAAWLVTALILTQIALGGWTSANYAAMACSDYPLCQGQFMPTDMDWSHAFVFNRELGQTSDGQMLSLQTLTAIHWTHRSFALVVLAACVAFALRLKQHNNTRRFGVWLLVAVIVQVLLGISNVWMQWPLGLAVLHNTGAAVLLAVAVYISVQLQYTKSRLSRTHIPL
jgi:cytochrome c oxidase assembly protein subunit 15